MTVKLTISKSFTFDAAHRLVRGYKGKCSNLHGHTWRCTVFFTGRDVNKFTMLRDFDDVKILKQWVDDFLDHATLFSAEDHELSKFLAQTDQKRFEIPAAGLGQKNPNPTSEAIAQVIYRKALDLGFKDLQAVEIDETCTSKARYEHV